jgi:hypothetical protein
MKKTFLFAAILTAMVPVGGGAAQAQRSDERFDERSFYDERRGGGWNRIGEIETTPRIERALIRVNPRQEIYTRLGLRAFNADAEIVDVNIRYGNNETERIRVNKVVRAGTGLPPIDLSGRGRRLREIEVVYRPLGPVRIEVVGREAGWGPGAGPGGRWQELGCKKVGLLEDRDVIRVGRREGAFRALKLVVSGNKLRLDRLRVTYANGQTEELVVRTVIPDGSETRPIDLSGRFRGIESIELRYIPSLSLKGPANVCVLGL